MKALSTRKALLSLAMYLLVPLNIGAQELMVIRSEYLKCNDSVLVFTPVSYSHSQRGNTPVLFLLHGWSGNYKNWSEKTDIQAVSDKYGFIIITPDGFYNSWYLNNVDPAGMQWRTFFDKELYPLIMDKFDADPEMTFITGLSMGGHGAINIFLDDPERFRAAGSMSGVLNLMGTRLKNSEITKILGPYSDDSPLFLGNSAVNRLDSLKTEKIMLITCGTQDHLAGSAVDFCKKCDKLKIPNILVLSPGVHSWQYWVYALDLHLFYFSRIVKGEGVGY
jgi:S-formylglutathione hydrolase FrmB